MLITFVMVQCVLTTQFGISNAKDLQALNETTARVVVNLNRLPSATRACYFESMVVGPNLYSLEAWHSQMERNRLTCFNRLQVGTIEQKDHLGFHNVNTQARDRYLWAMPATPSDQAALRLQWQSSCPRDRWRRAWILAQ